uniref:Uncharacterized protein n=1 Tax=Magallana gigas TaxID=29159 RepID=K1QQD4_MAGGI
MDIWLHKEMGPEFTESDLYIALHRMQPNRKCDPSTVISNHGCGRPPSRTPPYLQSILSMTAIPFTVLLRLVFLRKGVSPGRGICCAVIIVGLFISSEPQIWGLNTQQTENNASSSLLQRILWPMCFALGFVPFALVNLTCEKVLTTRNSEALNFILWSQLVQIPLLTGFFWTDFIPGFGMLHLSCLLVPYWFSRRGL